MNGLSVRARNSAGHLLDSGSGSGPSSPPTTPFVQPFTRMTVKQPAATLNPAPAVIPNAGTYKVGDGPLSAVFSEGVIYVVNNGGDSVTKLNALDGTSLGSISVGRGPVGLAVSGKKCLGNELGGQFSHEALTAIHPQITQMI